MTRIIEPLSLGAAGYLIKQTSHDVLSRAIREVQRRRKTFFSPSISSASTIIEKSSDQIGLLKAKDDQLSSRETEVLQLVAEGNVNETRRSLASASKRWKNTARISRKSSTSTTRRVSPATPSPRESSKAVCSCVSSSAPSIAAATRLTASLNLLGSLRPKTSEGIRTGVQKLLVG